MIIILEPQDIKIVNWCSAGTISWGEVASLALEGHPSNDGFTTKIPYWVDVLFHRPALHPALSCRVD